MKEQEIKKLKEDKEYQRLGSWVCKDKIVFGVLRKDKKVDLAIDRAIGLSYNKGKQQAKSEAIKELNDLQNAYDIVMLEINRLRDKLEKEIKWRKFNIQHQKEFNESVKKEAIKEFEKMINEIRGRCCVNKLQELKQKLKEMK